MSEKVDFNADIKDLVSSLGRFIAASPNENQYIITQIFRQIEEGAEFKEIDYLEGDRGYEPVITLEASGITIAKRIFHPRNGPTGADFAISKLELPRHIGISVVQVKRNHGKQSFSLVEDKSKHEIDQLRRLHRSFGSSYYLMIDETRRPPAECFVMTSELVSIINEITGRSVLYQDIKRVSIPNDTIQRYCRSTRMFYRPFYACRRGSRKRIADFMKTASEYSFEAKRLLIEILASRKYSQVML